MAIPAFKVSDILVNLDISIASFNLKIPLW